MASPLCGLSFRFESHRLSSASFVDSGSTPTDASHLDSVVTPSDTPLHIHCVSSRDGSLFQAHPPPWLKSMFPLFTSGLRSTRFSYKIRRRGYGTEQQTSLAGRVFHSAASAAPCISTVNSLPVESDSTTASSLPRLVTTIKPCAMYLLISNLGPVTPPQLLQQHDFHVLWLLNTRREETPSDLSGEPVKKGAWDPLSPTKTLACKIWCFTWAWVWSIYLGLSPMSSDFRVQRFNWEFISKSRLLSQLSRMAVSTEFRFGVLQPPPDALCLSPAARSSSPIFNKFVDKVLSLCSVSTCKSLHGNVEVRRFRPATIPAPSPNSIQRSVSVKMKLSYESNDESELHFQTSLTRNAHCEVEESIPTVRALFSLQLVHGSTRTLIKTKKVLQFITYLWVLCPLINGSPSRSLLFGLLSQVPPPMSRLCYLVSNSIMEQEMKIRLIGSLCVLMDIISMVYEIHIVSLEITIGDKDVCLLGYLASSSCYWDSSVLSQSHSLGSINVGYDYGKLVGAFVSGLNVKIFQGFLYFEQASKGLGLAREWTSAQSQQLVQKIQLPGIISKHKHLDQPEENPICESDAAWSKEKNEAGLAWIITESSGNQIKQGATLQESVNSPLVTEALALRLGIIAAVNLGLTMIKKFSDNSTLIRAINNDYQSKEIYGIVKDFQQISSVFVDISFSLLSRSVFVKAELLAKRILYGPVVT